MLTMDFPVVFPLLFLTLLAFPVTVIGTGQVVRSIRTRHVAKPRYLDYMMLLLCLFIISFAVYLAAMAPGRSWHGTEWRSTLALIYPWVGFAGALVAPVALSIGYRRFLQSVFSADDTESARLGKRAGRCFGVVALFLVGSLFVQHLFLIELA